MLVENRCQPLHAIHSLIAENREFLIGAEGENRVIDALQTLPDTFHVINDFQIVFPRSIHWRAGNIYIRRCQIIHVELIRNTPQFYVHKPFYTFDNEQI